MSIQEEKLAAIADAIRAMDGSTGPIPANDFPGRIRAIQTGIDTSDATAAAGDILSGKTAYGPNGKITGTIASKGESNLTVSGATVNVPAGYYPSAVSKSVAAAAQAAPSISVSTSGLITASAAQEAGYVAAGTKSATRQLTTQAAATITPGTAAKTAVASGRYTTGAVTVAGSSNLVAGNIKSGVNIFGVTGSYAPSLPSAAVTVRTTIPMLTIETNDPNGSSLGYGIGSSFGTYSISFTTTLNGFVFLHANKQNASPPAPSGSGFEAIEYGPCSGTLQFSYVFAVLRITSSSADITWNP